MAEEEHKKQRRQQLVNEMMGLRQAENDKDPLKQGNEIRFGYASHKNAKDLHKLMKKVVDCVDETAHNIKLSH
jgi:hypothetical protein